MYSVLPRRQKVDAISPTLDAAHLEEVLEHVNVPSYHIDPTGVVRWLNAAARSVVGDVRGSQFTSVVVSKDTRRARELFARKVIGAATVTDAVVEVVAADGARVAVEISWVPVYDGDHLVGVFGQVSDLIEEPHVHPELHLTPRQSEVLALLERGLTTRTDRPRAAPEQRHRPEPRQGSTADDGRALAPRGGRLGPRSRLTRQ